MNISSDQMIALIQNVRTLNEKLSSHSDISKKIDNLTREQSTANELKKIELGLMVGTITKEQARVLLSNIDEQKQEEPQSRRLFG